MQVGYKLVGINLEAPSGATDATRSVELPPSISYNSKCDNGLQVVLESPSVQCSQVFRFGQVTKSLDNMKQKISMTGSLACLIRSSGVQ